MYRVLHQYQQAYTTHHLILKISLTSAHLAKDDLIRSTNYHYVRNLANLISFWFLLRIRFKKKILLYFGMLNTSIENVKKEFFLKRTGNSDVFDLIEC